MSHSGDDRLTVAVDLMAEPCLWRWEIRDPKQDEVVASSWDRRVDGVRVARRGALARPRGYPTLGRRPNPRSGRSRGAGTAAAARRP
jgi:hypothetical protein